MPELPDVEVFKHRLTDALDKRIDTVAVQNRRVLAGLSPGRLQADLAGHRFRATRRHGKYLFAQIDAGPWLAMHFGMTGEIKYFTGDDPAPDFDRLRIDFVNGAHLAYYDQRLLGRLRLIDDPDRFIADKPLGPDALDPDFDYHAFHAAIGGARGGIKAVLMDQAVIAGIGNAYSDEILHRARLSPVKLTSRLSDDEIARVHVATHTVLHEWTDRLRAERGVGFPEKVTAFREEMAVHGKFGQPCPVCGTAVQRIRYADNETNYCPRCQTEGRLLADRALSRLLKQDWPRRIEELEG